MMAKTTRSDGILVCDDAGFPKQRMASVGIARQYSGTMGKVGHGQIAVTYCYTDSRTTWQVAGLLYLPQSWAYDPERLQ
jgi:SRSO17 transposase